MDTPGCFASNLAKLAISFIVENTIMMRAMSRTFFACISLDDEEGEGDVSLAAVARAEAEDKARAQHADDAATGDGVATLDLG